MTDGDPRASTLGRVLTRVTVGLLGGWTWFPPLGLALTGRWPRGVSTSRGSSCWSSSRPSRSPKLRQTQQARSERSGSSPRPAKKRREHLRRSSEGSNPPCPPRPILPTFLAARLRLLFRPQFQGDVARVRPA